MNQELHPIDTTEQVNSSAYSLQVYSIYRFVQASILILIFLLSPNTFRVGSEQPLLFIITALIYLSLCTFTILRELLPNKDNVKNKFGALIIILIDVGAVMSFVHFSGGITGTLSILLVVTIAAASILLVGRFAFFIAALASIAILMEQIYITYYTDYGDSSSFVQAGFLGFAFFGTALITQQLATRLRESERLTLEKASQVEELEKINEQIIERMPNGIVVVNDALSVKFMNTASWRMLGMPNLPSLAPLEKVSTELFKQLNLWLLDPNTKPSSFKAFNTGPSIYSSFIPLGDTKEAGILIYLNDSSIMSEQAQRLKLASLGTLTAGIAHEIRNPLGAISHAAQLLIESKELGAADFRLTNIIQQHSLRMNRIIENVLQISRQKPSNLESTNLKGWLEKFINDFKTGYPHEIEASVKFNNPDSQVQIDTSQLSQVLTNLCENGLRHSYAHTKVRAIKLVGDVDPDTNIPYLDIIDKGPGILPDVAEHIFEPFYTTDAEGSGLGLFIARELCEANRARLDYMAVPTGGSCFRISFANPQASKPISKNHMNSR